MSNRCYRGFGKCNAFWSFALPCRIWTYFETNYAYGNIRCWNPNGRPECISFTI